MTVWECATDGETSALRRRLMNFLTLRRVDPCLGDPTIAFGLAAIGNLDILRIVVRQTGPLDAQRSHFRQTGTSGGR